MKKIVEIPQECKKCGAISPHNAPAEWGLKWGHRTPYGEPCDAEGKIVALPNSIKRNRYTQERIIVSNSFVADEVNSMVNLLNELEKTRYPNFINNKASRNVHGKFLRMQKRFQ